MFLEILCKNKDGSLDLALLSLSEDGFQCLNIESGELLNSKYSYQYDDIHEVVLRTRSEHMDIRFKPPYTTKDRFRLCSSYNQIIVNELYRRTKGKVNIMFEVGSFQFPYGVPILSTVPPIRRPTAQGFFYSGNNEQIKLSSLLSNQNSEAKQQLDEVDSHLTQISRILGNIKDMSVATTTELERQNEQIDQVTNKTTQTSNRIDSSNLRVKKLLK